MFKLSWRPLLVMILVFLALAATACAPATEVGANNAGDAALDNTAKPAAENVTEPVKMVFTQQDDGREFFGTVEAMDGDVWTVSGQRVTIGAGTEIKNNIAVGSQVKVHTVPQADGTVLVREIELAPGSDSADDGSNATPSPTRTAEREFFGAVEAMDGDVWTISGQQVTVSASTEIKNSIAIGDRVKVHALPQSDGTLLVREIELAQGDDHDDDDDGNGDQNDDGEFRGQVEAINGNVWTISGQQVTIGTGTEVKGNIAAGSQVKVHTLLQADGTLLAREIELAGMDDDMDDMDDDSDDDLDDDSGDDMDDDSGDDMDDDSGDDMDDDSGDDMDDDSGDNSDDDQSDDSDDDDDDSGDDSDDGDDDRGDDDDDDGDDD